MPGFIEKSRPDVSSDTTNYIRLLVGWINQDRWTLRKLAGASGASGARAERDLGVHARDGIGRVDGGVCSVNDTPAAEHAASGRGVGVHSGAASATTEVRAIVPGGTLRALTRVKRT